MVHQPFRALQAWAQIPQLTNICTTKVYLSISGTDFPRAQSKEVVVKLLHRSKMWVGRAEPLAVIHSTALMGRPSTAAGKNRTQCPGKNASSPATVNSLVITFYVWGIQEEPILPCTKDITDFKIKKCRNLFLFQNLNMLFWWYLFKIRIHCSWQYLSTKSESPSNN